MGFQIAQDSPQSIWCPVAETAGTLYVGQLVRHMNCGVAGIATASGTGDLNRKALTLGLVGTSSGCGNAPFGVIIGTNKKTPTYSGTYNAEYITFAQPNTASVDDYVLHEGPWARGDLVAMVKVALIDATTVLKAPLYQSSSIVGTAPTVGTVTTDSSGGTCTTNTTGVTGVDSMSTIYFRSGAAAGSYRITMDTSATTHTYGIRTNSTVTDNSVGDTLVKVNLPAVGKGRLQVSTPALWVQSNAAVTADYWMVDVVRLDLSTAGSEYVEFRFDTTALTAFNQLCC